MAPKGKTAPKSTKSRRGAPPPVAISRPKPWGLIAATLAVVLFAGAVIGYAVSQVHKKSADTPQAKAADAKKIDGIAVRSYPAGVHKQTNIAYDQSPPFGGEHDPEWADCSGTVYSAPIRNENAVHSLEHGAIWITYRPGLSSSEVDSLKKLVDGKDYMLMSPYLGLKTKVSLQAWGYQLFVDSATDKRIKEFVDDLRLNSATTPEFGAQCTNPQFKSKPRAPDSAAGAAPGSAPTMSGQPAPSVSSSP